jgi:hypothetical protein
MNILFLCCMVAVSVAPDRYDHVYELSSGVLAYHLDVPAEDLPELRKRAVGQNDALAARLLYLALSFEGGEQGGVEEEVLRWQRLSASLGNSITQLDYGVRKYRDGDVQEGLFWVERSAVQGLREGMSALALILAELGHQRMAVFWERRAALSGNLYHLESSVVLNERLNLQEDELVQWRALVSSLGGRRVGDGCEVATDEALCAEVVSAMKHEFCMAAFRLEALLKRDSEIFSQYWRTQGVLEMIERRTCL